MSVGEPVAVPHDDAVVRTRQSWQRTALGAAAVTLLVVRGLVIDGAPRWVAVVGVLPGAAVVFVALARNRRLATPDGRPGAEPRTVVGAVAAGLLTVALVGLVVALG